MDIILILLAVRAVLALFLFAFSLQKRATPAVQFTFLLMWLGNSLFFGYHLNDASWIRNGTIALMFLAGPSVWWLVRSQISGSRTMFHWIHMVPFPVAVAFSLGIPSTSFTTFLWAASISRIAYGFVAGVELWRNRHALAQKNRLVWLAAFILMLVWSSLWSGVLYIMPGSAGDWIPIEATVALKAFGASAVTLALMWWAIIRPEIYLDTPVQDSEKELPVTDFDRDVFARLEAAFKGEGMHRQDTLSLASVADTLAVTPRELSNAVNRCSGQSFRAYLRSCRVADAKEFLADPARKDSSVFDIAMDAGFGTKSVFNDAFKAEVGMTPSEYRLVSLPEQKIKSAG